MSERLFLPVNKYTRPQETAKAHFKDVRGYVIHWFENPRQSARACWNYMANDAPRLHRYGGAHYIMDEDVILYAIPEDELSYHVDSAYYTPWAKTTFGGYPPVHLIGVEMAHADMNGRPTIKQRHAMVEFLADKFLQHKLNPYEDLMTHWQVTYKCTRNGPCHRWFVEHPEDFDNFKAEIKEQMVWIPRHDHRIV